MLTENMKGIRVTQRNHSMLQNYTISLNRVGSFYWQIRTLVTNMLSAWCYLFCTKCNVAQGRNFTRGQYSY
jgi:hypothetical protein